MTSEYCHYLERQLLDEQRESAQLAEVAKNITRVKEKLKQEEKNTESLEKAYNVLEKDFEKAKSELKTLNISYQGVVKENSLLEANVIKNVDEFETLQPKYQAVMRKNGFLRFFLAILVAQIKILKFEHQTLAHENTSLKVNLAENQYQNQVLLSVTDTWSQQSHDTVHDNDVDNNSKRLEEEFRDSIEREQAYDKQDEAFRDRERRCAEQEKNCNECKQSLMLQEQSLKEREQSLKDREQSLKDREQSLKDREQSLMKREKSYEQQDETLKGQVKGCNDKEDEIIEIDKEISRPQLKPLEKRKFSFSISLVPEKQQRSMKRRCTSWQIKAAEYLKEDLISAWLLNPWSFWSPGKGRYRDCISATLINHGRKSPPLERMRLMVAHLWLVWEGNQQAELDKIDAKSFKFGSQIKQNLDRVDLRYALHTSFAPKWR